MERQLIESISNKTEIKEIVQKKLDDYNKMGTLAKNQLGGSLILDSVIKTSMLQIMKEAMISTEEDIDKLTIQISAYQAALGRELSKEEINKFINEFPTLNKYASVKKKDHEERSYNRCMQIVQRIETQQKK